MVHTDPDAISDASVEGRILNYLPKLALIHPFDRLCEIAFHFEGMVQSIPSVRLFRNVKFIGNDIFVVEFLAL